MDPPDSEKIGNRPAEPPVQKSDSEDKEILHP